MITTNGPATRQAAAESDPCLRDFERSRLRVGILGSTGAVGQKFIRLLSGHPWFRVTALAASVRSQGRSYEDAVRWLEPTPLPEWAARLRVGETLPTQCCDLVFSALDAEVARKIEPWYAEAGIPVISNAPTFRMDPGVPLLVPEVNPEHMDLLEGPSSDSWNGRRTNPGEERTAPPGRPGFIVTNPNCSTTGLVLALKPLADAFPLTRVAVTTMQAVSGAGYPGVPSMDILGNVVPEIPGEEEKLETEPLKILGRLTEGEVVKARLTISAQCNRVPVLEGHILSVSVGFDRKVGIEEAREAWEGFRGPLAGLGLPSAPELPVHFSDSPAFPQPRLHADRGWGMTVSVGRLRECPVLGLRFVALVHNTVRGAAGGAILNAELLRARGLIVSGGPPLSG